MVEGEGAIRAERNSDGSFTITEYISGGERITRKVFPNQTSILNTDLDAIHAAAPKPAPVPPAPVVRAPREAQASTPSRSRTPEPRRPSNQVHMQKKREEREAKSQAQPEQPARLTPGQVAANRLINREIDRRMQGWWGISWRPPGPVPTSPQDRSADALRERGPVRENRSDSHRGPEYHRPDDTTRPHGSAVVYPRGLNNPRGSIQERDPNSVRGPGIGRGIRHTPHR